LVGCYLVRACILIFLICNQWLLEPWASADKATHAPISADRRKRERDWGRIPNQLSHREMQRIGVAEILRILIEGMEKAI
jgi:hypothetical protein